MIRKGSIFLVCLAALIVFGAIVSRQIFVRPPAQTQTLPDGNTLTLTDTKVGSKVRFVHGTLWERLKQNVLPAKGITFGSHSIVPPKLPITSLSAVADRRLFLEFTLNGRAPVVTGTAGGAAGVVTYFTAGTNSYTVVSGGSTLGSGSVSFIVQSNGTVVAAQAAGPAGTATRSLPASIPRTGMAASPATATIGTIIGTTATGPFVVNPVIPNGQFRMILKGDDDFEFVESFWPQLGFATNGYVYIEPQCYPRDSSRLTVRIERRDTASQTWKSVADFSTRITPESGPSLRAQKLPLKKTVGGFDFVLGEVSVRETTFPAEYIGKYQSDLSFQVLQNGVPQTNWEVFPLQATDSAGNNSSLGSFNRFSNGWYRLQTPQVLDANRPWRLRMSFGRATDFPATQLASFDLNLTPISLAGLSPITNNLLGTPVRIYGDTENIHIELPADRTDLRVNLVRLRWPNGPEWQVEGTRWNERHIALHLSSLPALGNVNFTIAIHPNYPFEFVVRPDNKLTARK